MRCVANEKNRGKENVDPLDGIIGTRLGIVQLAEVDAKGTNGHTTLRYDLISVQILHSGQSIKTNLKAFQRVASSAATSPRICARESKIDLPTASPPLTDMYHRNKYEVGK